MLAVSPEIKGIRDAALGRAGPCAEHGCEKWVEVVTQVSVHVVAYRFGNETVTSWRTAREGGAVMMRRK